MKALGYAAQKASAPLAPYHFERREVRANDVSIEILYCGVCHSDLHQAKDDFGFGLYPMVPGHEIVGQVLDVGQAVTKFKVGDKVAVGCFVDSCLECDQCKKGDEQFCREGVTMVFSSEDKISGGFTDGGFSKHIVVQEHFVLSIPDKLEISTAAPILCAGITTYSPLKNYNIQKGSRVGIIGLGGLGHMAIKLAKAMGATVTVITRSESKIPVAEEYGADHVLMSSNGSAMQSATGSLDMIIDTVPVKHSVDPYVTLLDVKGVLVIVGQIGPIEETNAAALLFGNKSVAGSMVGGLADTQEVLDFCAKYDIQPVCEMIAIDQINEAFERLERGEIAHRFVIDMKTLKNTT